MPDQRGLCCCRCATGRSAPLQQRVLDMMRLHEEVRRGAASAGVQLPRHDSAVLCLGSLQPQQIRTADAEKWGC
jgi:uncharacterized protein YbcC (UPF0753/DUF2309 family)